MSHETEMPYAMERETIYVDESDDEVFRLLVKGLSRQQTEAAIELTKRGTERFEIVSRLSEASHLRAIFP